MLNPMRSRWQRWAPLPGQSQIHPLTDQVQMSSQTRRSTHCALITLQSRATQATLASGLCRRRPHTMCLCRRQSTAACGSIPPRLAAILCLRRQHQLHPVIHHHYPNVCRISSEPLRVRTPSNLTQVKLNHVFHQMIAATANASHMHESWRSMRSCLSRGPRIAHQRNVYSMMHDYTLLAGIACNTAQYRIL